MNIIKKKIFSQKLIIINLYFHSNVLKYFGNRIIDTLIHIPLSYINNNYKESYDINEVGKIITLDLQVLEHITGYNKKSPLKIITTTKSKQILNIFFFGNFKSFYIKKFKKIMYRG